MYQIIITNKYIYFFINIDIIINVNLFIYFFMGTMTWNTPIIARIIELDINGCFTMIYKYSIYAVFNIYNRHVIDM